MTTNNNSVLLTCRMRCSRACTWLGRLCRVSRLQERLFY